MTRTTEWWTRFYVALCCLLIINNGVLLLLGAIQWLVVLVGVIVCVGLSLLIASMWSSVK
ncbi:MAG TPA: hypothetical protein VIG44_05940 [Thermomicrobiales bacterium]